MEAALLAKLERASKMMRATFLWRCLHAWAVAAYEHREQSVR